jgi:hypothetical protein
MDNYPICETIEEYEPQFDDVNNCYRDMNNSEIKIKYGNRSFRCCGVEYTKGKRSQFINQHCKSNKHQQYLKKYNDDFKQNYGTYNSPAEIIKIMEKQIRELKKQLYNKNEECKYKDDEIEKLNAQNEILQSENIKLKIKKSKKKLNLVPEGELIGLL